MKSFKDFILRGNLMDLAVGVIIGTSFNQIITSLVQSIIMPPINIVLAKVNFKNWFVVLKRGHLPGPYLNLEEAHKAGAITLNIGDFITSLANFLIIALCLYAILIAIHKVRNTMDFNDHTIKQATTKNCQYCYSSINIKATRCPYCTSELGTSN